jgi:vacuolar-type H+-ATPase subunit F/Vma7
VGRVAAIGTRLSVEGFGLAGALVYVAEDVSAARVALRELPGDVAVVVLTADAAEAVADQIAESDWPLVAVLPAEDTEPQ